MLCQLTQGMRRRLRFRSSLNPFGNHFFVSSASSAISTPGDAL